MTKANSVETAELHLRSDATQCPWCDCLMVGVWTSEGHEYFLCSECRFVTVIPVPSTEVLKDYYARAYVVDQEGYRKNLERHARRDIELLERIRRPGCMLEVGCSWGLFLDTARNRGWDVCGIELSQPATNWARERLGLDVSCSTIEESPFLGQAMFDVVVAWHVIEHMQDSRSFLKLVRSCLRPRGLLAVRTPNVRSLPARLNRSAWQWVGAPAHLSLFSCDSLRLAVEQAGFTVRHLETRRGDANNPWFEIVRGGALRTSLHQRIKRLFKLQSTHGVQIARNDQPLQNRRRAQTLELVNSLFDIGCFPLYPIERLFDFAGWGPELFLVAERND